MRIFVAIDLDTPAYFQQLQEPLRRIPGARMTFPSSYHLTLAFLGDVAEPATKGIVEALSTVSCTPFTLLCDHIGAFPSAGSPRVVWAGFAGDGEGPQDKAAAAGYQEIMTLQKRIETALKPLGFKPDKQFSPHITLARVKHLDPTGAKALHAYLAATKPPRQVFTVSSFSLYSSTLSAQGPVYKEVGRFPITPHSQ